MLPNQRLWFRAGEGSGPSVPAGLRAHSRSHLMPPLPCAENSRVVAQEAVTTESGTQPFFTTPLSEDLKHAVVTVDF